MYRIEGTEFQYNRKVELLWLAFPADWQHQYVVKQGNISSW